MLEFIPRNSLLNKCWNNSSIYFLDAEWSTKLASSLHQLPRKTEMSLDFLISKQLPKMLHFFFLIFRSYSTNHSFTRWITIKSRATRLALISASIVLTSATIFFLVFWDWGTRICQTIANTSTRNLNLFNGVEILQNNILVAIRLCQRILALPVVPQQDYAS